MEWLLELMGHIRNVVYGTTAVECADIKLVRSPALKKHKTLRGVSPCDCSVCCETRTTARAAERV